MFSSFAFVIGSPLPKIQKLQARDNRPRHGFKCTAGGVSDDSELCSSPKHKFRVPKAEFPGLKQFKVGSRPLSN